MNSTKSIESVLDGTNQMCDYPFDGYRVLGAQILIGWEGLRQNYIVGL